MVTKKLLRVKDVLDITLISNSTMYELMKENKFPKPIRIGRRAVAWLESDIQKWIDSRPTAGSWEFPEKNL